MKQRMRLFNLLLLVPLLLQGLAWQNPHIAHAAQAFIPNQLLQAQMQPAQTSSLQAQEVPTASTSTPIGPPAAPPLWATAPGRPLATTPTALTPPHNIPVPMSGAITITTTLSPEIALTPEDPDHDARLAQLEAQKLTQLNAARQHQVYLPLLSVDSTARSATVAITSQGGRIQSPDGSISLEFPAGAVSEEVWVTLTQGGAHPPLGLRQSLGIFFELTARTAAGQEVTQFTQAPTLRARYIQGDIPAGTVRRFFYFDTTYGIWVPISTYDDVGTLVLTAATNHVTQFAALATNGPFLSAVSPDPGSGTLGNPFTTRIRVELTPPAPPEGALIVGIAPSGTQYIGPFLDYACIAITAPASISRVVDLHVPSPTGGPQSRAYVVWARYSSYANTDCGNFFRMSFVDELQDRLNYVIEWDGVPNPTATTIPTLTPTPIPDTTPPIISAPQLEQNGQGGINFTFTVTDNRAVNTTSVIVTVDTIARPVVPSGTSYQSMAEGLGVGTHNFEIKAADTSGNWANPVRGTFRIERSDAYGFIEYQGYSPDPVNTFIGNYIYRYTDLKLVEQGPDLEITRFYNSQNQSVGRFGQGWDSLFDMRLRLMDNLLFAGAVLTYPDGRTVNFPADGNGFGHAPTVFDTLERDGSGYKLTRTDHTRFFFDDQGRLMRIEDTSGNALTLAYSGDMLNTVTASSGRALSFTSNVDGLIEQISGPGGLVLTYAYNDAGRLTSMTDGTGVTVAYRYDANNGMIGLQTPQGHDFLAEQEFDDQGRVTFQRVGDNFINRFVYDDANRTTTLSDTYGNTITYRYDEKGRLIEQTDSLGHSEQWTYNSDNQRTSYTDRNGSTTTYTYNAQGDLIAQTDALGGVTTNEYDGDHNLLKTTDALGRVTSYEYDAQGRRTAIIDALGGRTEMRYNAQGQLIAQISPRGFSTTYAYDAQGNLISQTDPLGAVTQYEYDAQSRWVKTINANGDATRYAYDENGNLLTVTDAYGGTTTYSYDSNNNRVSETDANGNTTHYSYNNLDTLQRTTAPDGGVTTITYDGMNHRIAETDQLGHTTRWGLDANYRVISETNALGATTLYEYDPQGNRISVTDPNGHTTRYVFDALNRVTQVIDPLGNIARYRYDAVGNRTSETNALGATTLYEYDELNRVWRQTDANGYVTTSTYDADGNRVSSTDALGNVTRSAYDANKRLISSADALGHTTQYAYDPMGNQVELIDARGFVTRSEYDALNRRVALTNALGQTTLTKYDGVGNQVATLDALGHQTRMAYDMMNRLVEVVDALGHKTLVAYDLAGRRISTTDANGNTTLYRYDAVGRSIETSDPLGFSERYAYDAAGNQVSQIDKNGHLTRTEYDALNRIVAQTNPLNATTRFVFDAAGNQIARIDALGNTTTYAYDALGQRVEEANALGFVTRNEYDGLGRVVRTTFADGSSVARAYDANGRLIAEMDAEGFITRYAYDANGNRITVTDPLGFATETSYDALSRPVQVADNLGTIKQTSYDAAGNVISQSDGNGNITRTSYDALNRPISATDAAGHVSSTSYDVNGNRISVTDVNGHTTRLNYDARNQLIASTDPLGHTTKYTFDGVGQQIYAFDALNIITTNVYDAAGQLVAVTLNYNASSLPNAQTNVTTRYAYDLVGNRTSITNPNGSVVRFTANELGQLVAESDALGNITRYVYDSVGRQVQRQHPDGTIISSTYNRNGQLIRTSYPDGSAVMRAYDGNRNLLELRDPSGTTRYSYDARGRMLSESTDRGMVRYAYDGANNRTSITYADGQAVRYAYDASNALAGVTNPDGSLTTYERDGVGQLLRQINGNGTTTSQRYDAAGNLLAVETHKGDQLIASVAYVYNEVNQRTSMTSQSAANGGAPVTETYTQDALRRLVAVSDSNGVQTSYRYDAAGNRLGWESNDDPRTSRPFDALDLRYSYDAADALVQAADQARNTQTDYRYDANGNRVEQRAKGEGTRYYYDAENRLVSVETVVNNGTAREIAAMAYDGQGRRVIKAEVQTSGGSLKTTSYIYVGLDPIASYEGWSSAYTNLYRGEGGRILSSERASDSAWFTQDGLGSTLALTDNSGSAAHAYRYDPYGAISAQAGSSNLDTDYTFSGQELDASTGLYHFHARAYDPATATWLTRDPYTGSPSDPQSLHRYGYVQGNPVNLWDAYGYAAMGGTYGKGEETDGSEPFLKFMKALKERPLKDRMWSFDFESPRIPNDWPLPGFIKDPLNRVLPKVDIETEVGYEVVASTQIRTYIYENAITTGPAACLTLDAFARIDIEADVYKTSFGVISAGIEVGGNIGLTGRLEGCFVTELGSSVGQIPIRSNVAASLEASLLLTGEFRIGVEAEANIFLAKAEGELGLRAQFEYPLLVCGIEAKIGTQTGIDPGCPNAYGDFVVRPGVYAEFEWQIPFNKGSWSGEHDIAEVQFRAPTLAKALGWAK